MSEDLRFLEIEHKFVLAQDFDASPLLEVLRQRGPERFIQSNVKDTYFLVEHAPKAVYRHRIDSYLQQLTVKSLGPDNEVRLEVNLPLDQQQGNQLESVRAFLAPLGLLWQGTLAKEVSAFYFPEVEVVFYKACYEQRTVICFEIEARHPQSMDQAQNALRAWEDLLGLDPAARSQASLLELLVVPTLSQTLQAKVRAMRI